MPGAYPCLGILGSAEILAVVAHLPVHVSARVKDRPDLFALALHDSFASLPEPIRIIHQRSRCFTARGRCDVDHGSNPVARLIGALFRLPRAGRDMPVKVTFLAHGGTETWERDFAGRLMRSQLRRSRVPGHIVERFGPFAFIIRLRWDGARLHYEITGGKFLGLHLPHVLLPRSDAFETVTDGMFRFDVRVGLPLIGLLAHYRGWLAPDPLSAAALDRG
jgi:hypothetical protein